MNAVMERLKLSLRHLKQSCKTAAVMEMVMGPATAAMAENDPARNLRVVEDLAGKVLDVENEFQIRNVSKKHCGFFLGESLFEFRAKFRYFTGFFRNCRRASASIFTKVHFSDSMRNYLPN